MRSLLIAGLTALLSPLPGLAEPFTVQPVEITDWKAVFGRIEAKDSIPARARLSGMLTELTVADGDEVAADQPIATIVDEKITFQLSAIDGQLQALDSQLANAKAELTRGEELLARGVTTAQRLDALRTQVDVLVNQIAAQKAQRRVVEQQAADGVVVAPIAGRVLNVPVAAGAVVMAGEPVATIGGGGFFLRLAVPERHAPDLNEGATIHIVGAEGPREGKLAKVYPQIENGRVIADVEVEGLDATFVDARVLVRLPVGAHRALMVPADLVENRSGIDFVTVAGAEPLPRAVVTGQAETIGGVEMVEIVTGLSAGEVIQPAGESHE